MRKYATAVLLDARLDGQQASFRREAHRATFDYTPERGYLYVRSRAISSRTNDNFDDFPAEEIRKGWRTFIGKPVFVNHRNDNHRRARGVIVDAALHEDINPDGSPDTWCEVLMEVDAVRFPKLAQAILAGEVDRTSMGCDVDYSICTFCGNRASTPLEYCAHIPRLKGSRIRRVTASGETEDVLVAERCYGLRFFENSLLVEEPADPTAFVVNIDDRGLRAAASRRPAARGTGPGEASRHTTTSQVLGEARDNPRPCPAVPSRAPSRRSPSHDEPTPDLARQAARQTAPNRHHSNDIASHVTSSRATSRAQDVSVPTTTRPNPTHAHTTGRAASMPSDRLVFVAANPAPPHDTAAPDTPGLTTTHTATRQSQPADTAPQLAPSRATTHGSSGRTTPRDDPSHGPALRSNAHDPPRPHWPSPPLPHDNPLQVRARQSKPHDMAHPAPPSPTTARLVKHAEKAFISAKLDYWKPPGYTFANAQRWKIAWNTSPDPKDWGGPIFLDSDEFDPQAATAAVEAAGLHDVSDWEWLSLGGIYRATAQWDRGTTASKTAGPLDYYEIVVRYPGDEVPVSFGGSGDRDQAIAMAATELAENPGADVSVFFSSGTFLHTGPNNLVWKNGNDARQASRTAALPGPNKDVPAPPEVDTLRDENCPVCGEDDAWNGEECEICGFVKPPDMFMDPDTDRAKQVDLREETKEDEQDPAAYDPPPGVSDVDDPDNNGQDPDDYVPPSGAHEASLARRTAMQGKGREVPMGLQAVLAELKRVSEDNARMASIIEAQQSVINRQAGAIGELHDAHVRHEAALGYVAGLMDLGPHVASILNKTADEANPANPVPQPASQSAPQSTDEARAPDTTEDVMSIGGTDGANTGVPAAATDSVTDIGASPVTDTAPSLGTTDVTAPVEGTTEQRPDNETVIETEQRMGEGDNTNPAFPWTLSSKRFTASHRLARLRIAAGIEDGDDLSIGQRIAEDQTLDDASIEREIHTLEAVRTASRRAPEPEPQVRDRDTLVAQANRRVMPSLAGDGMPESLAPAMASLGAVNDDEVLFD